MNRTQMQRVAMYTLPSMINAPPSHDHEHEADDDASGHIHGDQLPALIWTTDVDLRLTSLNGADLTRLDGVAQDAVGRHLAEVFPSEDRDNAPARAAHHALGGRAMSFEFAQGSGHYFGLVEPYFGGDGTLRGTVAVAVDICDQQAHDEERLREVLKRLDTRHADILRRLAGGIAHNFNNLLSVVLGSAFLALRELPPESSAYRYVAQIETAAQAAADQAALMLLYSEKTPAVLESVSFAGLILELRPLIHATVSPNVAVEYDLAERVPDLEADRTQLRHLIMTLIFNASEAIGNDAGMIRVRTQAIHASRAFLSRVFASGDVAEDDYLWLQVSDTGCGMDDDTREAIFEPYFSTKFTGRGMGLASARGIVHSHHGAMAVSSKPGLGTTFHVLLPLAAAEIGSAPKQLQVALAAPAERHLSESY